MATTKRKKTTAPAAEVVGELHLVFVGLRAHSGSFLSPEYPPSAAFVQLTDEEVAEQDLLRPADLGEGEIMRYDRSIIKELQLCRPGAVYKFSQTTNGIQYRHRMMPTFYLSGGALTLWNAIHRAVEKDWEAIQRLEKDARGSDFRRTLDPIRDAYYRLGAPQRAQLIADVVAYITRGTTSK